MIGLLSFLGWLAVSVMGYVAIWRSRWEGLLLRAGLFTFQTVGVIILYVVLGRLVLDAREPGWSVLEYLLWPLVILVASL